MMWFKKLFLTKRASPPNTTENNNKQRCLHIRPEALGKLPENSSFTCRELVIDGREWVVIDSVVACVSPQPSTSSNTVRGLILPENTVLQTLEEDSFEDEAFSFSKLPYRIKYNNKSNFEETIFVDRSIGDVPTDTYFGLTEYEDIIIRFDIVEYRQFRRSSCFADGIDYPGKKKKVTCRVPVGIEAKEKKYNMLDRVIKMFSGSRRKLVEWIKEIAAPPRLQALRGARRNGGANGNNGAPGDGVRAYALHLAADKTTTFAKNVENFITCTKDSKETCPHIVMRNMRQFMSGMKNYLVKHGEREFEKEVEKERIKLKANEFLNLDSILEGVLHGAVITPLRSHIYGLLADKFAKSGDVAQLATGMRLARFLSPLQLGIRPNVRVPSNSELVDISQAFVKMQEADSPLHKLEHLLAAISLIFNSMKSGIIINSGAPIGADDFLPVLVLALARCSVAGAELEAEVMAGLLPPPILAGEGGYYLTTLFGAVAVLKKISSSEKNKPFDWRTGSLGSTLDCGSGTAVGCGVARVLVPDEFTGALRRVALPWRAGTRARDLCRALAHRARITNPQDYALYALHDGEEIMINEPDCLQDVVSDSKYSNCMFAYKRSDAKIAWPKQAFSSYS